MPQITKAQAAQFWDWCLKYLKTKTDLKFVSALSSFEGSQNPKKSSMESFYMRFLESLKNRQGMPNSIGDLERLRVILFDFSPSKVNAEYGNDWKMLFSKVKTEVRPSSRMDIDVKQNYWVIFSKGALDSASFLSAFSTADELAKEFSHFAESETFCAGLPMLLASEIHGYGFPLACDFLKECGWTQYSKADVHTKKILQHLGLSDGTDYETFKAMQIIAKHVDQTPYAVDKHIWLIGSGDLYNQGQRLSTSREDFFRFIENSQ